MSTKNEITEQSIKVPSDILIDIFSILLKEDLKYEVVQVLENRSIAIISIEIDNNKIRQVKVFQNIQNLLHAYNDFRHGENESFNWRED